MENNPQQGIGYSLGKASTVIREARARLYDFVPGASQILAVEIASFTNWRLFFGKTIVSLSLNSLTIFQRVQLFLSNHPWHSMTSSYLFATGLYSVYPLPPIPWLDPGQYEQLDPTFRYPEGSNHHLVCSKVWTLKSMESNLGGWEWLTNLNFFQFHLGGLPPTNHHLNHPKASWCHEICPIHWGPAVGQVEKSAACLENNCF